MPSPRVMTALLAGCALQPTFAQTATDTTRRLSVAAFVDAYYAYDFGRPPSIDRRFTTQAARHSEFNVNLAFLEARLTGERVRGRLAAQFGTSVQANYASEPTVGAISGADVSRFIQEAAIGYRVSERAWIDAGIFMAPFGGESWISADNWTYTRSMIADNSPYYASGVKATMTMSGAQTAQLLLLNGWQNISETNSDKAVALRWDWAPSPRVAVAYDVFAGNEQPDSTRRALRVFHEVIVRGQLLPRLEAAATLDYGEQQAGAQTPAGNWNGWAVLARARAGPTAWITARFEGYSDPKQLIVGTGSPLGLRARGASLTLDVAPRRDLLWRFEARRLSAESPLFPQKSLALSRTNLVVLSAVTLRLD